MADHGAIATASFLDCGLPSTVGAGDLAPVAKAIISKLNDDEPDLIVLELGDGILGGYAVDSLFDDAQLRDATAAFVFCASDYVGAWGGIELLRRRGIKVDLIAGSVTDSQMGQDYIETEFGVPAANARRDGARMLHVLNPDEAARDGGRLRPRRRAATRESETTKRKVRRPLDHWDEGIASTKPWRRFADWPAFKVDATIKSIAQARILNYDWNEVRAGIFGGSGYASS